MDFTKIKSFEDACAARNYNPEILPGVADLPSHFQKHVSANYKLLIIAEAINLQDDGKVWQPDWSNYNECKYFPYFEVETEKDGETNKAGFGFSASGVGYWYAYASVGSRLCFATREQALYFGETFADLHLETQLIR